MLKKRSYEPELMDMGTQFYTETEYNECLYQLDCIGKYSGNNTKMLKTFSSLPYKINSILDVGCGGGLFTLQLAKKFSSAKVYDTDISIQAIDYAKNQQKKFQENNLPLNNLNFELRTNCELIEPEKSFDIVTSSLVCHHLSDESIVDFLKRAAKVAKKTIIINDLNRHWLAYVGCSIIMPMFSKNKLILKDSLLSIKKSFTYDEWINYLQQAGFKKENYKISWHWPFRWIIKVDV